MCVCKRERERERERKCIQNIGRKVMGIREKKKKAHKYNKNFVRVRERKKT